MYKIHIFGYIDIEGIAGSDLEVAAYIERLDDSNLMDNVTLLESKEYKSRVRSGEEHPGLVLRQFKLTAMLSNGVHLSVEDIKRIRAAGKESSYNF